MSDEAAARDEKHLGGVATSSLPLFNQSQVPPWLREPFIHGHYRARYSWWQCLLSLFALHNQSGNVWTHLGGLIFFCAAARHAFGTLVHSVAAHQAVFAVLFLGLICCMLCSTCFHLCGCHVNRKVHSRLLALDYFGITACIIGSFYVPTYLAFTCIPFYRWIYLGIITMLGAIGLVGPRFETFNDPAFQAYRIALYVSMTVFGLVPTCHVVFVLPLNTATLPFIYGVLLMLALYAIGLVFYLSRFPERCFPGRFDLCCHSHQLWHLFVLAAAIVHVFTCFGMYIQWVGDSPSPFRSQEFC